MSSQIVKISEIFISKLSVYSRHTTPPAILYGGRVFSAKDIAMLTPNEILDIELAIQRGWMTKEHQYAVLKYLVRIEETLRELKGDNLIREFNNMELYP